jgi:hypothetical protein
MSLHHVAAALAAASVHKADMRSCFNKRSISVQASSSSTEQHLLQMLLLMPVAVRPLQALTMCTYVLCHDTLPLHNTTLMHAATTRCRTGAPNAMDSSLDTVA